jgi:hypothetical protein
LPQKFRFGLNNLELLGLKQLLMMKHLKTTLKAEVISVE